MSGAGQAPDDGKEAEARIEELAALLGIDPEYHDIWGNLHTTSIETKRAIIRAMGLKDTEAALRERRLRPWNRLIAPVMVVTEANQPASIPLHFPLEEGMEGDAALTVRFEDEDGGAEKREYKGIAPASTRVLEGARYVRVELPIASRMKMGYHRVNVEVRTPSLKLEGGMRLIVTPARCHLPEARTWGLSLNLYSVRSRRNWGSGDLGDLREITRWVGKVLGGGFVGINPLHACSNRPSLGISPYSPISRLYRNPIYIDMASALADLPEEVRAAFEQEAEALREAELIDYEKAAALKTKALRAVFEAFMERRMAAGTDEAEEFREYVNREGEPLESFAVFMALGEHLRESGRDPGGWQDWPPEYRGHGGPAVKEFMVARKDRVLFHQFLQWLLERQMKEAREEAEGMALGIYTDLAVGSSGLGSDAWSYPGLFAFGVSAGAPPDAFNPQGQNWGFPPLIPERLMESGYELFIRIIRKNLLHARAMRIDHALGIFRLFWIPEGMPPHEGAYIMYPFDDLLGIIALESVRNRAVIIAEDLGTISAGARETLKRSGLLSYRLLYFERDRASGRFLPHEAYPENAITAVTTHDLPTLRGYWSGRDIEVKRGLGIYPAKAAMEKDLKDRARERQLMLEALRDCLPHEFPTEAERVPQMSRELFMAAHRFLARTPCRLVAVNLDDILFTLDQQNMPGTLDNHPNWQRKTKADTDEIFRNEYAHDLARIFREEKRG